MNKNFAEVNTEQVHAALHKAQFKLLDVRAIDAYNGWEMRDESRGGHIPGARSMPAKWTRYIDWIDILKTKNINPEDKVVLYGDNDVTKIGERFRRAGFSNINIYPDFVQEWIPDSSLPLFRLQRYQHLVSAKWLRQLLTTGSAPEYGNRKHLLCHAHYQNPDAYLQGHIPTAVEMDTNTLESSETWNRRSPGELQRTLQELGITVDTTVILYGRFSFPDNNDPFPGSSAGQLAAIRCALIMMYAGVRDVRVLNGGLQAWIDEGFELATDHRPKQPTTDFGAEVPQHPELFIDTPEAKEFLKSPNKNLVSVRSWREFIGEVSGYHYIRKKGRIPGAVFSNCGSDAYHMENFRNFDNTVREYHEIEQFWREAGITPDKHNAFYCGTGWRASEAFLNAWLMGWPNIAVYDGGWFEWSNDSDNPCETGAPARSHAAKAYTLTEAETVE